MLLPHRAGPHASQRQTNEVKELFAYITLSVTGVSLTPVSNRKLKQRRFVQLSKSSVFHLV